MRTVRLACFVCVWCAAGRVVYHLIFLDVSPVDRNDLYFVIERGEFERGGKSSSKNVEVTVQVLDEFGRPIQVQILIRLSHILFVFEFAMH